MPLACLNPFRANSESLLWHRLGTDKLRLPRASVSPLVNTGVTIAWGKEGGPGVHGGGQHKSEFAPLRGLR